MHIRRQIERFLRRHDMTDSRFGRAALNDPTFVRELRGGRNPRERTVQRVEHFMNRYEETVG